MSARSVLQFLDDEKAKPVKTSVTLWVDEYRLARFQNLCALHGSTTSRAVDRMLADLFAEIDAVKEGVDESARLHLALVSKEDTEASASAAADAPVRI